MAPGVFLLGRRTPLLKSGEPQMSSSIDRLENLIRVLRGVAPGKLNMSNWRNCAVGRASRDQFFIDEGLSISGLGESPMAAVAEFFGISGDQSYKTFLTSGYVGPSVLGHLPPRMPQVRPWDRS
jgi:hypothetical protein